MAGGPQSRGGDEIDVGLPVARVLSAARSPSARIAATIVVISVCVAMRVGMAQSSYSGMGTPPMFGDYEAQRHWMELTIALPVGDWYRNTTDNDLLYWGLDYPPLTAYVSWACGKVAEVVEPDLVALHTSRGHETLSSKLFMRATVLVTDVLYIAAAYLFMRRCTPLNWASQTAALLVLLSQPALLLIDHGHFQYNSFSLGLVLASVVAVHHGRDWVGALLFTLALNFKTMMLYFSPAVFFFYLARCIQSPTDPRVASVPTILGRVAMLAVVVLGTFALLWYPFCVYSPASVGCSGGLMHVVRRLFPFSRGLFEDKVSNLWCIGDIVFKFRRRFELQTLVRMSTGLTLALMAPSGWVLVTRRRRDTKSFLWALFCSSMSFFLASFQVHEKSILLPLLPAALLGVYYPAFAAWFGAVATFSMYPLLVKDGLVCPYYIAEPAFLAVAIAPAMLRGLTPSLRAFLVGSLLLLPVVHAAAAHLPPSITARYPDMAAVLISAYSCALFVAAWLLGNYMLLRTPTMGLASRRNGEKQHAQ